MSELAALVVYAPTPGCNGHIVPADQTVQCESCGLAWWGDESDEFEDRHPIWMAIDYSLYTADRDRGDEDTGMRSRTVA